ncbi:MAG TPA: hypothetical protein VL983_06775 [Terriglobales bacterium]|nr:hypothetical protein [Terriglobales bacterium]
MVSYCLNPACKTPFSHTGDGRVFTVDPSLTGGQHRQPGAINEQYWLCGTCSRSLKVVVEDGHIKTVPIETETASLAG